MTSILIELQRGTPACGQQAWGRILASAKWELGVAMGKFFLIQFLLVKLLQEQAVMKNLGEADGF